MFIASIVWVVATLLFFYLTFQKMDIAPWKGLIPGYNAYNVFREFEGNGFRVFMLLIPVYGIIVWIRLCMKWAQAFGKGMGYGVGIAFLPPIFLGIIALDNKTCYQKSVRVE